MEEFKRIEENFEDIYKECKNYIEILDEILELNNQDLEIQLKFLLGWHDILSLHGPNNHTFTYVHNYFNFNIKSEKYIFNYRSYLKKKKLKKQ